MALAVLDLPARPGRGNALACAAIAVASGALFVLATAPIDLWPLAWLMLVPTLWLIDRAPTVRRAAAWAWLSGATASVGGFHWIADLLVRQGGLPVPLGWLGLLLLSAYQGLMFFFAARAIRAMRGRGWPMALAAPLALVTVELCLPLIFPYGLFITQAPVLPVIQIAELTGPLGVTALLAAAGGGLWDLACGRRLPALLAAAAVGAGVGYGVVRIGQVDAARAAAPTLKVGLISEGVASRTTGGRARAQRLADLAALQATSAEAAAAGAELLVWTETGFPFDLPRASRTDLSERSPYRLRRGFSVPLVFGALTEVAGSPPYNSATLLGPDDRFVARHDKVHRVLGSEYNPVVEAIPSLESLMPAGAGHFAAGDAAVLLPLDHGGKVVWLAPMICFEDILPAYGREVAAHRPSLLVNLTNDSWFGPDEPWQHLALAVFRSVEIRADMVRAVNLGPSTHVDATGRVVATGRADHAGPEALVVEAALLDGGGTPYARVGNLFAYACTAVTLLAWLVLPRWPRRGKSDKKAKRGKKR
jgi:apolipoprotein N-acyltransferase